MKPTAQRDHPCFSLILSPWSCCSKRRTAVYLCCILLSSTLTGVMRRVDAARTCTRIVGSYRDCLCGIMYRDVEERCDDEDTHYLPEQSQQNLSCPFRCLNGGILHQNSCLCNARPDAPPSHGLCCEVRKSKIIIMHACCNTHAHWEVT